MRPPPPRVIKTKLELRGTCSSSPSPLPGLLSGHSPQPGRGQDTVREETSAGLGLRSTQKPGQAFQGRSGRKSFALGEAGRLVDRALSSRGKYFTFVHKDCSCCFLLSHGWEAFFFFKQKTPSVFLSREQTSDLSVKVRIRPLPHIAWMCC